MKLASPSPSPSTSTFTSTRWLLGLGIIITLCAIQQTSCHTVSTPGASFVLTPMARYNTSSASARRRAELAHSEHSPHHVSHHMGAVRNINIKDHNDHNNAVRAFHIKQVGSTEENMEGSSTGETESRPVISSTGGGEEGALDSGSSSPAEVGEGASTTDTGPGPGPAISDGSTPTATPIPEETGTFTGTSTGTEEGIGTETGTGTVTRTETETETGTSDSATEAPTEPPTHAPTDANENENEDPTNPPTQGPTEAPTSTPYNPTEFLNEDIYDADWTHMPLAWHPPPFNPKNYDFKRVKHGDAWILHNPIGHFSIIPPITEEQVQGYLLNVSSLSELQVEFPLPTPLPTVDVNGEPVEPLRMTASKQLNPGCGGLTTKTSVNALVHGCHVATNGGYFQYSNKTAPHHCFGTIVSDSRFISYNPHNISTHHPTQNVHFGITSNDEFFFGYPDEDLLARMPNGTQPPDSYNSSDPHTWYFKNLVMGVGWLIKDGKPNIQNYSKDHEDVSTPEGTGAFERFINVESARTAIGVNTRGELVIVVMPGKTWFSGINLNDLTSVLLSLNVTQAINLDGGGSATAAVPGMVSFVSDECDPPTPILACERPVTTITCIHNSRTVPPPTQSPPTSTPTPEPTPTPTEEPTPTPTPTSNLTTAPTSQEGAGTDTSKTDMNTSTDITIETLQKWQYTTYGLLTVIVLLSLCFYWYYRQQQPHEHLYAKASVELGQLYGSDASDDDRLASDDDGMGRHARSQRPRSSTFTRDPEAASFDVLKHRESDMEAI